MITPINVNQRMNCAGMLDCGPLTNSNNAITKGYTPFVLHGTVVLKAVRKCLFIFFGILVQHNL